MPVICSTSWWQFSEYSALVRAKQPTICQVAALTPFPNLTFPNLCYMTQTDMPQVVRREGIDEETGSKFKLSPLCVQVRRSENPFFFFCMTHLVEVRTHFCVYYCTTCFHPPPASQKSHYIKYPHGNIHQ